MVTRRVCCTAPATATGLVLLLCSATCLDALATDAWHSAPEAAAGQARAREHAYPPRLQEEYRALERMEVTAELDREQRINLWVQFTERWAFCHEGFNSLGLALLDTGRPLDAAQAFRSASTASGGDLRYAYNAAEALRRAGAIQDAIELLRPLAVQFRYQKLARPLRVLAELLQDYGNSTRDWKDCYRAYRAAWHANPSLENAQSLFDAVHMMHYSASLRSREVWVQKSIDTMQALLRTQRTVPVTLKQALLYVPESTLLSIAAQRSAVIRKEVTPLPSIQHSRRDRTRKEIRIAVLSSDFRASPVSFLAKDWFQHLTSSESCTVVCIDLRGGPEDEVLAAAKRGCSIWLDALEIASSRQDALGIAQYIAQNNIDVVLDLDGLSRDGTAPRVVQALRKQRYPVAIHALGTPSLLMAPEYSAFLADPVALPPELAEARTVQGARAERVLYVPAMFAASHISSPLPSSLRPVASRIVDTECARSGADCGPLDVGEDAARANLELREALGVSPRDIVLASFAQSSKIDSETIRHWRRVLQQCDRCKLALVEFPQSTAPNATRNIALALGKHAARKIVWFPFQTQRDQYAELITVADLVLDTIRCVSGSRGAACLHLPAAQRRALMLRCAATLQFRDIQYDKVLTGLENALRLRCVRRYNGGCTLVDAIHAGVPVVTAPGSRLVERMGASIGRAAELQTPCRCGNLTLANYAAVEEVHPSAYAEQVLRIATRPRELQSRRCAATCVAVSSHVAAHATCKRQFAAAAPLFDLVRVTKRIAAGLRAAIDIALLGRSPMHIAAL